MKTPILDDKSPRWRQPLFKLSRIVSVESRHRCVCFPSRGDAKEQASRVKRQYGDTATDIKVTKNGKGTTATFTCAYTLHETKTEELF